MISHLSHSLLKNLNSSWLHPALTVGQGILASLLFPHTFGTRDTFGNSDTFGTRDTFGNSATFGTSDTFGPRDTFGNSDTFGPRDTFGANY